MFEKAITTYASSEKMRIVAGERESRACAGRGTWTAAITGFGASLMPRMMGA